MRLARLFLICLASALLLPALLHAQRFIDPNKGNIIYTKKGIMDGNMVRTIYLNHGEVGHWPDQPSGEWPRGSGHTYVDGVAVIVQAEAQDINGKVIHPLETNYREFIRTDPVTKIPWGWAPLPGYAREKPNTQPAMSNKPETWPLTWPDRSADWNGLWNGFFGRGIMNADIETYFRMDDAPDKQYRYYPDPTDTTRGGLGLQVAVRGFQWSQVLAADVIFWYYEITNIAKQDYTKTVFAQYVDWGIGGVDDSSDDQGMFDTQLDIAWAYDGDNIGNPGRWTPVGVAGYAFLESPGISTNGEDDDDDGFVDERRDNDAGTKIQGTAALTSYVQSTYNVDKFLSFYVYGTLEDVPAFQQGYGWTGDENLNWRGFNDVNGNGIHDPGEVLNDDTGADGLSPFDAAYPGPDPDGTEGDGKPEQGEPDFGILDKDESDQIGLTGFSIFPVHFYELHDDEQNWQVLTTPIDPSGVKQLKNVNLGMYFSAGARPHNGSLGNLFPLVHLQTERFSMALLFGNDRDDLVRRKRTVQQVYNANYRFAKPPDRPRMTAVAGDKRVTLYWDDRAERSYDPFLREYDFEGYRIYRSTEASFLEDLVVTDAFGKKTFREPLAQYDLKDGVRGLHPIDVNGVKFDLGSDTGLRHTFVDSTVQNGQTYYYAVVSYDKGFVTPSTTGVLDGIPPSECTSIVNVDINGNAKTDINTAVVVPSVPAAGFVAPGLEGGIKHSGPGTGFITVAALNSDSIRSGHTYKLAFTNESRFQNAAIPTATLTDQTENRTLFENLPITVRGGETSIADGMLVSVANDSATAIMPDSTRWIPARSSPVPLVELDVAFTTRNVPYPADFELRFTPQVSDTSVGQLFFGAPAAKPTNFNVWNLTDNSRTRFMFYDADNSGSFSVGDRIILVFGDSLGRLPAPGNYRTSWSIRMLPDTMGAGMSLPKAGDVLRIMTTRPFRTGETFEFTMRQSSINQALAKSEIGNVGVVPNPYVAAASWEPPNLFRSGRGERRIYFVNLPAECTIRIYTVRGYLVQTLYHSAGFANGQEPWNLVTKDGMDAAYGVYVYHVQAPNVGEKIGRFAIIK